MNLDNGGFIGESFVQVGTYRGVVTRDVPAFAALK
jgi:hypothetical protein